MTEQYCWKNLDKLSQILQFLKTKMATSKPSLDLMSKSFNSKQWGIQVNISSKYLRTDLKPLLRKISEKSNLNIFGNKDGHQSAILNPISKSLNSKQWGT